MSERQLRIAVILCDEREVLGRHSDPKPFFGTAPTALIKGLADTSGCEVHLVCCVQRPVQSPTKLANNIHFHSLVVPRAGWLRSGYLGCIIATRSKLRGLRPHVVHGQGTERHYALCAAFSGFPNVITIHGNMRRLAEISRARPLTFDWCTARLEAFALPRVGGVICPTHHTRAQVQPSARRTW